MVSPKPQKTGNPIKWLALCAVFFLFNGGSLRVNIGVLLVTNTNYILGIGVKWPISEKIFGHMWLQLNFMTINLMTH